MLDTLRKQQATWKEKDGAVEAEDRVTIDFTGSVDGEEFEGGKASDFVLAMGQGRMIPGFEDGIKGHKAGEEFTIDVTFPEEYHAENLKGKAAKFAINLKKVEERELPELTAEFIKRFGVEDGSVEGLRAEVRKNMERELKSAIRNRVKSQAIEGLVKANDIDVPAALIDSEIDVLRRQAAQRFGGNEKQALELPRELFEEQAKRRVVVGLLPTVLDVVENPKNLKIVELEAPQLPRSLDDAQIALAVINTTYASQIGLTPAKDGIFVEDKDSPYVNLIVTREDNKDAENVKKFVQAYQSDEVYEAANKVFNGGAVKGW